MTPPARLTDLPCAYCGAPESGTRDHVPPENLFPSPQPSNLITVPACRSCHGAFSLDDEYFRLAITLGMDPNHLPAEFAHSLSAIKKLGAPTKRRFARAMFRSIRDLPVFTPAGLLVGTASALDVDPIRVSRTVARIVRGLHFHHHAARVPDAHRVDVRYLGIQFADARPAHQQWLVSTFGSTQLHVLGNQVFSYRFLPPEPTTGHTAWLLQFYARHSFIAFTLAEA